MEIKEITKETLPPIHKNVLIWCLWGHRWSWEKAHLTDSNGKDGYRVWHSVFGSHEVPNQEYPDNLGWSIHGHPRKFDVATHWTELPEPLNKD